MYKKDRHRDGRETRQGIKRVIFFKKKILITLTRLDIKIMVFNKRDNYYHFLMR